MNRSEIPEVAHSKHDAPTPVVGTPRAPSTVVNLGALIGVSRDDGAPSKRAATSPPALRARVPTLQFYGSPPVIRVRTPPIPPRAIGDAKVPLPARASQLPAPPRAPSKPPALPPRKPPPLPPRASVKPPTPPRASVKPPTPPRASVKPPAPPHARVAPPRPARATIPPPAPKDIITPTAPLAALIAAELSRVDAPIVEASVDIDLSDVEPATLPILDAHDARSERPPALSSFPDIAIPLEGWRQTRTLLAAAALGAAAIAACALNVGVAVCVADTIAPSSSAENARALIGNRAIASGTSAVRAAPPPPACTITGAPRVIAHRALVSGGIEASLADGRVALGVTTSPRDGRAIELDLQTLATLGTARLSSSPLRRAVPLLPTGDVVDVAGDASDRARTANDPQRGSVALSPMRLWKLPALPIVDGVRAAPLTAMKGYAIALRRAGAIWLGATGGDDAQTPYAPLARLSEPGRRVGQPSVAVTADSVVVAWAESTSDTPWRIKWVRWRPGLAPESAHDLALPKGGLGEQAMSPSVAGLGDGRVLIAWTEGPTSNHQVRAQLFDADDAPSGSAFTLSADGVYSGQEQVAMGADGRGVVAFFASHDSDYDAVAVALTCKR